jgi:hypothetical protein
MMLFGLIAMATAIMTLWPETRAARWLHRHMVDYPLERAEQATRRQMLAALIMVVLLVGSMGEIAALAPGDLLFLYSLDLATYVEVVVTVWTVAAFTSAKGAGRALVARLPKRRAMAQRRRRRRTGPMRARKSSNDDDGADDGWLRAA